MVLLAFVRQINLIAIENFFKFEIFGARVNVFSNCSKKML